MSTPVALAFLAASTLFIIGIKLLSSPKSARAGNLIAAVGMLIALGATLPLIHPSAANATLIAVGVLLGLAIGAVGAYRVKMTAMPQMVALFNGAGGGAAALVAAIEFAANRDGISLLVGMLFAAFHRAPASFSGSIIAFAKLEGHFEKPITYPGQQFANAGLILLVAVLGVVLAGPAHSIALFVVFLLLALIFGVLMVLPIGGADMPVVISLLNSCTGLAVAADGFAISNLALIVAGTLVGSSGTLLTLAMCKAMNRPVTNVLFGAFGKVTVRSGRTKTTRVAGGTAQIGPFRPTKSPCSWRSHRKSSSSPDTAWPSLRPSTKCGCSRMNSASAAST